MFAVSPSRPEANLPSRPPYTEELAVTAMLIPEAALTRFISRTTSSCPTSTCN